MIEVVKSVNHPLTPFQSEALSLFVDSITRDPDFEPVVTCFEVPSCGLFLKDGTDLPCLAVAFILEMNAWTVCDYAGKVRQYIDGEVN